MISFNPLISLDKTPVGEAEEQAVDQTAHWIGVTPATTHETFKQKDSKQGVQLWTAFVRIPNQVLLPLCMHLMRGEKKIYIYIRIPF